MAEGTLVFQMVGQGAGENRALLTLAVSQVLTYLVFLLVQVECNSKLDPTKTTLLKV